MKLLLMQLNVFTMNGRKQKHLVGGFNEPAGSMGGEKQGVVCWQCYQIPSADGV